MSIENQPGQPAEDQQPFNGGQNAPQADEQPIRGPSGAVDSTTSQPGKEAEPVDNRLQTFTIPENPLDERYRSNRFAHVLRELIYWHGGMGSEFEAHMKDWSDTNLRWYDDHLAVGVEWATASEKRADFAEQILEDVVNHIDRLTAALRATDESRLTPIERPIFTYGRSEPYSRIPQRPRRDAGDAQLLKNRAMKKKRSDK